MHHRSRMIVAPQPIPAEETTLLGDDRLGCERGHAKIFVELIKQGHEHPVRGERICGSRELLDVIDLQDHQEGIDRREEVGGLDRGVGGLDELLRQRQVLAHDHIDVLLGFGPANL